MDTMIIINLTLEKKERKKRDHPVYVVALCGPADPGKIATQQHHMFDRVGRASYLKKD